MHGATIKIEATIFKHNRKKYRQKKL